MEKLSATLRCQMIVEERKNNNLNNYLLNKGFISVGGNNFGHNTLSCRISLVDLVEYENGIKYLIKILEELK